MSESFGIACVILLMPTAVFSLCVTWVGHRYRDARLFRSGLNAAHAVGGLLVLAFINAAFNGIATRQLSWWALGEWLAASPCVWLSLLAASHLVCLMRSQARLANHLHLINAVVMLVVLFGTLFMWQADPLVSDAYRMGHALTEGTLVGLFTGPLFFLGSSSATVLFALTIAGLVSRDMDERWVQSLREWLLACWFWVSVWSLCFLYQQYTVAGWEGVFVGDSMHRVMLILWLITSAFLHSIILQERRGMWRLWNVALAILTFLFALYGTFLQLRHAVHGQTLDVPCGVALGLTFVVSVILVLRRRRMLASRQACASLYSKEGVLLINNIFLVGGCAVLLLGLILKPLLALLMPIGFVLLLLAGFGPVMAWHRADSAALRRTLRWPICIGLGALGVGWGLGLREWRTLTALLVGSFTLAVTLGEFVRGAHVIRREPPTASASLPLQLLHRVQRRFGGYVVHVGLLVMLIGFIGAIYRTESTAQLRIGDHMPLHGYDLKFYGLHQEADPDHVVGTVGLFRDGQLLSWLYPMRMGDPATALQNTPAVYHAGLFDVFATLQQFDFDAQSAELRIQRHPLMKAVWIGGGMLILGTVLMVWPRRLATARVVLGASS